MSDTRAGLLKQLRALGPVTMSNIWRTKWASAMVVVCIALVVVVVTIFLSMARGFESAARSVGSDDVAVFLGRGAASETSSLITREEADAIKGFPGVVRVDGEPVVSAELSMTVGVVKTDGTKVNVNLRGLDPLGLATREGVRIESGRMFEPGRREIVVGYRLQGELQGAALGQTLNLAGRDWTVVGTFRFANPVLESELWADLASALQAYDRNNEFQVVRAKLVEGTSLEAVRDFVATDPRLGVEVRTERELYESETRKTSALILYVGWPLAAVLGVGCLAGILNTMLINLESRRRSLRVIRLLGFSRPAIVASVVAEATILAVAGAILGFGAIYFYLDGEASSMVGAGFRTVNFAFRADVWVFAQGCVLAMVIGATGAAIPAWRHASAWRAR